MLSCPLAWRIALWRCVSYAATNRAPSWGDARLQLAHFGNKIRTYLECHTVCKPVYNGRMDRFLTTFKPGTVMTAPGSCNCAEQKVSRKIQWCAVGGEPVCSPVGVVSGFLDCHVGCAPRNDSVRMK